MVHAVGDEFEGFGVAHAVVDPDEPEAGLGGEKGEAAVGIGGEVKGRNVVAGRGDFDVGVGDGLASVIGYLDGYRILNQSPRDAVGLGEAGRAKEDGEEKEGEVSFHGVALERGEWSGQG